ncbi:MAG: tRNA-dihydrouridine synthase [Candidatus Magasanikbacteria bacterium]
MWFSEIKKNQGYIMALAPMADFTDQPFCRVCREVANTPSVSPLVGGGRSEFVIFREMVSAEAIVRGSKKTLRMCEFSEIERPIVLQLFGAEPNVIVEAVKILVGKRPFDSAYEGLTQGINAMPSGIDINMGCPVPKIAKKGRAGADLMRDPERAVAIVKALKSANLGLPISVKTRLGWASEDEILRFAPLLEQAGVDGLTIHGRTKKQGYSGQANWKMIRKVKKLLKIPVIANGDIKDSEDIKKCLEITGADGVMIGRGALGNPWVLSRNKEKGIRNKTDNELKKVVLRHAELLLAHYGSEHGLKTFRKHLLYYFKGFPGVKELRQELVKVKNLEDLKIILSNL